MEKESLFSQSLKWLIWICLGVIFFSVLYVDGRLFFPYITSKTFIFMVATEIMFVAFLLLSVVDSKYRLRFNLAVILMGAYLLILTVASLFGNDFYRSFWSNNERSDGILLLAHLFLFILTLSSRFRSIKEWLAIFDVFLAASFCVSVVALDQYFGGEHFIASSSGARLASTIGNAGYVGGYMVFGVFLSLFMFFKRNSNWAKAAYAIIFFLELFIAIQTQTRGAWLALIMGLGVSGFYFCWFYWNNIYLKAASIIISLATVSFISLVFIYSSSPLVVNNQILNRISSFSLSDSTANNRLTTWKASWEGIRQRPLLGYGQENFYQVFDKYYTTKNTEQWFDRCHNMICDRAVTGGIIGLLGYLAMLLLPFWAIWKYYRKEYAEKTEMKDNFARRYFTPIIFSILILAYIVQNMFIFEALVTYIPLVMVLGFVGLYSKGLDFNFLENKLFKQISFGASLVALPISLNVFVFIPISANADFIKVLAAQDYSLETRINAFEEIIDRGTMGNQEYRRHYSSVFENVATQFLTTPEAKTEENSDRVTAFAKKMEKQLLVQIEENPYSVANYLTLMRFYNLSYVFNPEDSLKKAMDLSAKAIALSPGRPQVYYEVASSYYALANFYSFNKKDGLAEENYRQAAAMFYRGAKMNYYENNFFDQLLGFLANVSASSNSQQIGKALLGGSIDGKKMTEITSEMIGSLGSMESPEQEMASRKSQIKSILSWLSKIDPKNQELQNQLKAIK